MAARRALVGERNLESAVPETCVITFLTIFAFRHAGPGEARQSTGGNGPARGNEPASAAAPDIKRNRTK